MEIGRTEKPIRLENEEITEVIIKEDRGTCMCNCLQALITVLYITQTSSVRSQTHTQRRHCRALSPTVPSLVVFIQRKQENKEVRGWRRIFFCCSLPSSVPCMISVHLLYFCTCSYCCSVNFYFCSRCLQLNLTLFLSVPFSLLNTFCSTFHLTSVYEPILPSHTQPCYLHSDNIFIRISVLPEAALMNTHRFMLLSLRLPSIILWTSFITFLTMLTSGFYHKPLPLLTLTPLTSDMNSRN